MGLGSGELLSWDLRRDNEGILDNRAGIFLIFE